MNRYEELKPGCQKTNSTSIKGKRTCKVTSLLKTEATPGDTYYISLPALSQNQCIIPDTLCLSYKFVNSNTKSWFLNNLGKLLGEKLSVVIDGERVYENTGESILEVYKDLWKSDFKRKNMLEYGIADENVRKLMSNDDSGDKTTENDGILDVTLANLYERKKIKFDKILCGLGPFAPYEMSDFQYRITLPQPNKIMKAQQNEEIGNYKLTDLQMEYETIESEELANEVRDRYTEGRSLTFDYNTLLKTEVWKKRDTRRVIDINIPRKSLQAVVLLFTKKDAGDSENFLFPEIQKVNVTVERNSNDIYSDVLMKQKMYEEAKRYFGTRDNMEHDNIPCREFYTDKFALVVDFRTVDDETIVGSGRKIIGTQSGILLEIEKKPQPTIYFVIFLL